ncbi:MAG TPA: ribbon-helix-helix protein, CopG family [Myxococcaceae bacterium]|nr:ribbon-helix-helix protein, CopG family [Myxococcaceae bacterium]
MAARRTQIYLTADQRKRLDERRRRERRTLAELVREAVDAYLTDRSVDPATALNSTFGALPKLELPRRDEWERA